MRLVRFLPLLFLACSSPASAPASRPVSRFQSPPASDDHAVLKAALASGPLVLLSGSYRDTSAEGLYVPNGVTVKGPATIYFTNPDLQYGMSFREHVTVESLTLIGPWVNKDYDPAGRYRPGFNSGGGPTQHGVGIALIAVVARGFPGAGLNSGEWLDSLSVSRSDFSDNGDAGVQIDAEVRWFRVTGSRAERNRKNGFDVTGSFGYLADDTAVANGQAVTSYPDGASDLNGFFVWATTHADGRHDARENVFERDVATGNLGHGFSIVGGTTAAVRGTVLRNVRASGNGASDFHVQGNSNLDGLGDNRGTWIKDGVGALLYVQHYGSGAGTFVYGLRTCRVTFRTLADRINEAPVNGC